MYVFMKVNAYPFEQLISDDCLMDFFFECGIEAFLTNQLSCLRSNNESSLIIAALADLNHLS